MHANLQMLTHTYTRIQIHTQAELQQVAEALRQSTKQLCRNLKDNPNVQENMAKVGDVCCVYQTLCCVCKCLHVV
jgi:hypothetical protein